MKIYDLIRQGGYKSVSVVGLAKNAGKTVALNSVIRHANEQDTLLGLSSIGYDGEKTDILTRLAKPRITVRPGTLLATASATLDRASARLELVGSTGFFTSLGEVLIARVREEGLVEIAGPDSLQEMRQVVEHMQELGAALVLVDGALDRVGSAAPTVTAATIVSTGASVGSNMKNILTRTLHKVALFTLPQPQNEREALQKALAQGHLTCFSSQGHRQLPFQSAMGRSTAVVQSLPTEGHMCLVVPGAVTDALISEIVRSHGLCRRLQLCLADPTHIFASPEVWQKFIRLGGSAVVLNTIQLLAVTVNPTSPHGQAYNPHEFATTLAASLSPLPVYDLFMSQEPLR